MTHRTRIIIGSAGAVILAVGGFLAYAVYQAGHVVVPNAFISFHGDRITR